MRSRLRIVALLLAALALAGCEWVRGRRPNVLVVVVDTLRADRLGAYGSTAGLTPFLDSLADRGFVFRNAYAQTSWTNGSIASLFTSRPQSRHRVLTFWDTLADTENTLAEVLSANGFEAGGFNANFLVGTRLGFAQGFDEYDTYSRSTEERGRQKYYKVRGEKLNEECLRWLDGLPRARRGGIFLYLQYMEPHAPYDPPQELVDRVLDGRPEPDRGAVNRRMAASNLGVFSDDMLAAVTTYYDAEVMAVDDVLRRLFAELTGRGFLDDTVVVITADHGEELRDHGSVGHDQTLYQESIHVPLIVLLPGRDGGARIADIVSLTDVAPTLLDWLGIAKPPSFDGISLLPLMGGRGESWLSRLGFGAQPEDAPKPVGSAFSELLKEERGLNQVHERAVISATGKLIQRVDGGSEFYDLTTDPGETRPDSLAAERRQRLSQALAAFGDRAEEGDVPEAAPTLDADTRERMRALGYAE